MKCCNDSNSTDTYGSACITNIIKPESNILVPSAVTLRTSELFEDIPETEYENIIQLLDAQFETRPKGDYLYRCCDHSDQISILMSGILQGVQFDDAGNRSIIQTFRPTEVIGLPLSYGFEALYLNIVASQDSFVMTFSAENLHKLITSENQNARKFFWNIGKIQAKSAIQMKTRISVLSKRNTREKILYYLKKEAQYSHSLIFKIPLSRQEFADYLFVERTALSHQLSKLKKEGYFDYVQNEFHLNAKYFDPD